MGGRLRKARTLVALGVLAALCVVTLAHAAARRADLRASSVSNPPAELAPGASFRVVDAVKNSGAARAPKSVTRFFLSLDRRRSRSDVRLTGERRVKALRPKKSSRGATSLRVPAVLASAAYHLLACTDAAGRVRETSERNNCRASRSRTMVPAPGGSGGPGPPEPGPGPPGPGGDPTDTDGDGYVAGDCAPADAAIHPGADDVPDGSFVDANCDGMDGDESKAVFVSVAGSDVGGCGTRAAPCASIQKGIDEADAQAKRDVYVAAGDYARFAMRAGRNVYGGFGGDFARTLATAGGVTVSGGADPVVGELVTVRAHDIPATTRLADMTLEGADATAPGQSSYTVHAVDASLVLARVTIDAGKGAAGDSGAGGEVGAVGGTGGGASGLTGGPGASATVGCEGGPGADAPAGVGAGDEGDPGSAPPGAGAAGTPGAGGAGGSSGSCSTFGTSSGGSAPAVGQAGGPTAGGVGPAGLDGTGAPAEGGLAQTWLGASGGNGGTGRPGGGGGGGGSGGGSANGTNTFCTNCSSIRGGGGGGGGGGGAGGAGGGGGDAGGGSFGIYLWDSALTVEDSTVSSDTGGAGGAGGEGGPGGDGGPGGPGEPGASRNNACSSRNGGQGAAGAAGGDGGAGGHGGGGAGGPSIGIVEGGSSSADVQSTVITAGTPGAGGASPGGGDGATGIAAQRYDGS